MRNQDFRGLAAKCNLGPRVLVSRMYVNWRSSEKLMVMGPEPSESSAGKLLKAPNLTAGVDKHHFRKDTRMWIYTASVLGARGDDRVIDVRNDPGQSSEATMDCACCKAASAELQVE